MESQEALDPATQACEAVREYSTGIDSATVYIAHSVIQSVEKAYEHHSSYWQKGMQLCELGRRLHTID